MQKMQTLWCRIALLSLLCTSVAARADDASSTGFDAYGPTWQGLYAGFNGGGGNSAKGDLQSHWADIDRSAKGAVAGGQVGYNWRLSPVLVLGIEDDFDASGISTGSGSGVGPEVKVSALLSGRVRGGILAMDKHLLLYLTGGIAAGQVSDGGTKAWRIGETAGVGAEWALTPRWSARLEFLGTDLSRGLHHDDWGSTHAKFETVTLGMNYHF